MDYQQTLDRIITKLPSGRQVFLFSATFPVSIQGFMVTRGGVVGRGYIFILGYLHAQSLQD